MLEKVSAVYGDAFESPPGDGSALPKQCPENADNDKLLRATGRMLCNFMFRKLTDESKSQLVFCSKFSSFLFSYLCGDEGKMLSESARVGDALDALQTFDSELARTWRKLLDEKDLASMGLTTDDFDGDVCGEDAVEVTEGNIAAVVKSGCRHKLVTQRSRELDVIRDAFFEVDKPIAGSVPGQLSQILRVAVGNLGGSALEVLLSAKPATPTLVLRALHKGDGWTDANTPSFAALREIVGTLNSDEIKEFLRFVVGTSTISEREHIHVNAVADKRRLPESSTCHNELRWPVDATKARLLVAMRNASGSGFQVE